MAPRDADCPRCGGRLVRGFLPDYDHGAPAKSLTWVEGAEAKRRWWGRTVKGQPRFGVEAYRCRDCGRLELYAIEPEQ